jgi:hypothetical protein
MAKTSQKNFRKETRTSTVSTTTVEREPTQPTPHNTFNQSTLNFIKNHPPGKLAKSLFRLILTLLEYRVNNYQPIIISDFNADVKQLLYWLDEAEELLQTEAKHGTASGAYVNAEQEFFEKTIDFMYDHNLAQLSSCLSRLVIDFMQYELPGGYPVYLNELLPHITALLQWVDEGARFVALNPANKLLAEV